MSSDAHLMLENIGRADMHCNRTCLLQFCVRYNFIHLNNYLQDHRVQTCHGGTWWILAKIHLNKFEVQVYKSLLGYFLPQ